LTPRPIQQSVARRVGPIIPVGAIAAEGTVSGHGSGGGIAVVILQIGSSTSVPIYLEVGPITVVGTVGQLDAISSGGGNIGYAVATIAIPMDGNAIRLSGAGHDEKEGDDRARRKDRTH
jgi:hypothetical protein